ncbi:G-type lectin S-receptor-like serine/threonine-protein kinase [Melia azedarach]|uniref:G-type lectin S-receptor-like serine/threonine-protein kinase n=1 Tax=Melia azedarach TaxID=155640 RepID=A0ACC1Z2W5_MELAZ|nr:G-type lectin S-receptor-like serine/threonine-protein kinase [Melia azedarach]
MAWSTNTSGRSVMRLNLTDMGNLVLLDEHNATVWQSFDNPTDSLVPGQKLVAESKNHVAYSQNSISGTKTSNAPSYVRFWNGSLALFIRSSEPGEPDGSVSILRASSAQYLRLWPDGNLKVYEWLG